jgi:uncharacterized protein YprB with RNaseH-like and TPR domain
MSVLIIDIETTGLELQTHEITVIGTILYDPVKKIMVNIECFNVIINKIDENTQGMLDVKKRVAQILADCTSIVAFNGNKFDVCSPRTDTACYRTRTVLYGREHEQAC